MTGHRDVFPQANTNSKVSYLLLLFRRYDDRYEGFDGRERCVLLCHYSATLLIIERIGFLIWNFETNSFEFEILICLKSKLPLLEEAEH